MKGIRDLGDGIYRIAPAGEPRLIPAYSYLVTDGDRGVLVDPGPAEDFAATLALCRSVISPERIAFLILTSESPDACSSLPLWPSAGFSGRALAHWKTGLQARFYGGPEIRDLGNQDDRISFGDGRPLRFLNVPGLPTAGSMFCLDERSGSLFTGMALGSVGGGGAEEDVESPGRIESFHDLLFPSLGCRPDVLDALSALSPRRALPRNGPPVENCLSVAAELFGTRCVDPGGPGDLPDACARLVGEVNQRLADVFSAAELEEVLAETGLRFGPNGRPETEGLDPPVLLERYFDTLARVKGPVWISLVRAHVVRGAATLGIPLPSAFERFDREIDRGIGGLIRDIQRVRTENIELQKSIIQASDDHLKDPVTGYYNEIFFEEYLDDILQAGTGAAPQDSVAFVRLDGIRTFNERFGAKAGDAALKGLGLHLLESKRENMLLFRMNGPLFACYLQGEGKPKAVEYVRELQAKVEDSARFVEKSTVSAAIVELSEIASVAAETGKPYASLMKVCKERLHLLDKLGPASLCQESSITLRSSRGSVLLIEASPFEADLLRKVLEREGFEVHSVTKGGEALAQADLHRPDAIVSEIFVSQMDGFQIRQRLRASPDLKNIPFILVSWDKGEAALRKAFDLGIRHFFRKPVQPAELTGIIKLLTGEAAGERRP